MVDFSATPQNWHGLQKFNGEVAQTILENIALGKSVREVATIVKLHPATIYFWLEHEETEFFRQFQRARQQAIQLVRDDLVNIANNTSNDVLYDPKTGRPIPNSAAVQRDALKGSMLSKWLSLVDRKGDTKHPQKIRGMSKCKTADDIVTLLLQHLEDGELSVEGVEKLSHLADVRMKSVESVELKTQLDKIEARLDK
jgi:hypothetical protein